MSQLWPRWKLFFYWNKTFDRISQQQSSRSDFTLTPLVRDLLAWLFKGYMIAWMSRHIKTVYCQNSYICITWKGRDVYLKQLPKKSNIQTWLTSLFAVTAKIKYWNVIDKFTINLSSNFKVKFQDQKSGFYIGCSFRFWVLSHALTCWWWSSLSLTFQREQIFLNFHSQRTFDLKWALYDWSPAYKEKWKHESHIYHIYDISNTD